MKPVVALMALALTNCSSAPSSSRTIEERYARADWATTALHQAYAECQAEINRFGGTPSMYLCMRAKGWQER